ncbi:hypothetical protein PCK1_000400 [Pneumocystis canis]|nr:hypothetical protein PCK1_000400 [Pneumocystis canis]
MNNQEFLCQFCNNHHGKYLCPRCKQRYCSLTCYRNQTHLGYINIENASFEEIWERLNSSERNEFVHLALAYNEDE